MGAFPPAVEDEIYRGYDADDLARVPRYRAPEPAATPGFRTDYFGVKIGAHLLSGHGGGQVITDAPFPADGILSDGIEYASACIAMEEAPGPNFTTVELGAGWGPWTALMATVALRGDFQSVNAVAVEASPSRFGLLKRHLFDNALLPSPEASEGRVGRVYTRLYNAAAWWRETNLYFPATDDSDDAGMAATAAASSVDYRGKALGYVRVRAMSLQTILKPFNVVDFVHIDIQGGELELIERSKRLLDAKVRFMFVGTHSRVIEGDLIKLLHGRGWSLFREKPCRFYPMAETPKLEGATYVDGGQLWRNTRLP